MPIMKIGQTEQPFLRWDNPWLWIIGMIGISLLMKPAKKTNARKRNPVLRRNSPIPNEGLMMYNPNFCGWGYNPMPTKNDMFVKGNTKLGRHMWAMSLPRVTTCPGRSTWCNQHCYMRKIESVYSSVKNKAQWVYEMSKRPDFPQRVIEELRRLDQGYNFKLVRIHVDGDFYDNEYINKWIQIIRSMPDWQFYTYTKSWRVPSMLPALERLRALPNMVLRASTDASMNKKPPAGWLEAGVEECMTSPKPFVCKYYDKGEHCDTCRVCFEKPVQVALKTH